MGRRKTNPILVAVSEILDEAGASYVVEDRKHVHVKWTFRGHDRTTVFPHTASDHRAIKNAEAFVRRQLRELGYAAR